MTDEALDSLLLRAFLDAAREDDAEARTRIFHAPSPRHQREMRRMRSNPLRWRRSRLRSQQTERKLLVRVAAVLLAVLLGVGIWLSADEGARAALERWIWYELNAKKNYDYLYNDSDLQRVPHYHIGWIPEGYSLLEDSYYEYGGSIVYRAETKDAENTFGIAYFLRSSPSIGIYAPESAEKPDKLRINGMDVIYQWDEENDLSSLLWLDEKYDLVFSLSSSLGKEDCIHIAESVYADEMEPKEGSGRRRTEASGKSEYSLDGPGRYAAICRQAEEIRQRVAAERQNRIDEQERTGFIRNPDTGEMVELAFVSEETREAWNDALDMESISLGDAYILFSAADPHAEVIERQQRLSVEAERLQDKILSGRALTEEELAFLRENFPWLAEMAEGKP